MKIKLFSCISILFIGLIIGAQWHRSFIFPFPQLHEWKYGEEMSGHPYVELSNKLGISIYSKYMPVFLDRLYFDSIADNRLEGLYLLKIPRHYHDNIRIISSKDLIIYRAVSNNNNNLHYNDWDSSDIQINIEGSSTFHTKVIKKHFSANKLIELNPGGPIASDPIFIGFKDYVIPYIKFKILS